MDTAESRLGRVEFQHNLTGRQASLLAVFGQALRLSYDGMMQEDVPERFRPLVERLEYAERDAMHASKR